MVAATVELSGVIPPILTPTDERDRVDEPAPVDEVQARRIDRFLSAVG